MDLYNAFPNKIKRNTKEFQDFHDELENVSDLDKAYLVSARVVKLKQEELSGPKFCSTCWLLKEYCSCFATKDVSFVHHIHVYMHCKEFGRSSNTGLVLMNSLPSNSSLHLFGIKEDEERLSRIIQENPENTIVLTPSPSSITIQEYLKKKDGTAGFKQGEPVPSLNIIIVDGTWSQTRRMVNRLLSDCQHVCLESAGVTISNLRKQGKMGRITTAEAFILLLEEMQEPNDTIEMLLTNLKLRLEKVDLQNGNKGKKFGKNQQLQKQANIQDSPKEEESKS